MGSTSEKYSGILSEARKQSRAAFEAAQEVLRGLIEERVRIEAELVKVQSDLIELATICGLNVEHPLVSMGPTDAIRFVLSKAQQPITAMEIRLELERYKVKLPANPMALISTVLKRLQNAREIDSITDHKADTVKWVWTQHVSSPAIPVTPWMLLPNGEISRAEAERVKSQLAASIKKKKRRE